MNKRKIMMLLMACFMLISVSSPAMAAGDLSAVRSFSTSEIAPGDTLRVSVELSIHSAISTPAINEDLPEGWNLNVVNDGGASLFKESTLEWVFMSLFNAGSSRTIIYDVTVPSNTPDGTYTISGTYSANDIFPSKTLGDEDIIVSSTPSDPVVVPEADFSSNVVSGTFPLTVQFTDLSTGAPTEWAWDFNTDSIIDSTEQNPEHIFTSAGNFDVKLGVVNSAGSDSVIKIDHIIVSDPNDNPVDEPGDDGSEAESVSAAVSLGAEIIPAVGIVVTPGTINFGFLGAGEVSEVRTVLINNRGADDTIITADVMDAADDLFMDGLYVDNGMWDEYSTLLGSKEMTTADLTLHVPSDYSNIGSMKGILVVWAEIE
ncbi:PKD domain-containing protein [Methanococcoides sp. NM1]|uniref:PKD domain-containing protein n=1 Tax=Methanococcoides sp. NM1 TaxID=1201013 RepID=UPI001083C074|nr:PKD domain-containing protein [Methanococcoides sp. NM1]